ncbi:hypothetical protein LXL04_035889 [Taraxacum kok-saghyz]
MGPGQSPRVRGAPKTGLGTETDSTLLHFQPQPSDNPSFNINMDHQWSIQVSHLALSDHCLPGNRLYFFLSDIIDSAYGGEGWALEMADSKVMEKKRKIFGKEKGAIVRSGVFSLYPVETRVEFGCKSNNSELSSHQKKIFKVDDHIGVAIVGLTADGYTYESPLPAGRHRWSPSPWSFSCSARRQSSGQLRAWFLQPGKLQKQLCRYLVQENFKSNRSLDRQPEHTTHQYLRQIQLSNHLFQIQFLRKPTTFLFIIIFFLDLVSSSSAAQSKNTDLETC